MLSCDAASRLENIKGRFIIKDDELQEVQSFYFDSNNFNYGALKKQSLPLKAIFEPEKEETPLTSESALNFDFSDIKHKEK